MRVIGRVFKQPLVQRPLGPVGFLCRFRKMHVAIVGGQIRQTQLFLTSKLRRDHRIKDLRRMKIEEPLQDPDIKIGAVQDQEFTV